MKSVKTYIPNTITCLNLLCGTIATIIALAPELCPFGGLAPQLWAFVFIGAAAVFDFCDGFSARLLKAYSPMGKELDSLSDLVSFGIAPAMLVINAVLSAGGAGWVAASAILIVICGALRLAKFNVDTRQTTSFIGLPIPANAIFWIGWLAWINSHYYPGDWVMFAIIVAVSLLMVSEIKMFSLKFSSWGFSENVRRYLILFSALLFILTSGIAGLAWTILLYLLISVTGKKTDPDAH